MANPHNLYQSTAYQPQGAYQPQTDPYSAFRNSNVQTTSVFGSGGIPSHNSPNV
jgi:hypothetical protein